MNASITTHFTTEICGLEVRIPCEFYYEGGSARILPQHIEFQIGEVTHDLDFDALDQQDRDRLYAEAQQQEVEEAQVVAEMRNDAARDERLIDSKYDIGRDGELPGFIR